MPRPRSDVYPLRITGRLAQNCVLASCFRHMAGHSRWAQVKHKKAGADAKRSANFSKLGRLISSAAREGGEDPNSNAKLRSAIEQARAAGLPKDNIERAIKRASGADPDEILISRDYEAYGPGGSAYLIQTVTDNTNRTAGELKAILSDFGGKLADAGGVAWQFERLAAVSFPPVPESELEALSLFMIDAGASDIESAGGGVTAFVPTESLESFRAAANLQGLRINTITVVMAPKTTVALGKEHRAQAEALNAALEKHPDVTSVATTVRPRP